MAIETWYWAKPGQGLPGTSLNQPWWNCTTFGGTRWALPTLRGANYEVPFRSGQRWRPKYPDSRTITLAMWTAGIDQATGLPAADQMLAFNTNFQQLRSMFWTRDDGGSLQGTLTRQWYLGAQGSGAIVQASALAEIAGAMEPTMTGRTRADFAVDLLLADPYFYGAQQVSAITGSAPITNPGDGVVGEAYGAFTIKVTTNCTVTNNTSGDSVSFADPGGTLFPLTLDIINYTAFDSNGNNKLAGVNHNGARFWMALLPGSNSISVDHGTATFTWSPPYI